MKKQYKIVPVNEVSYDVLYSKGIEPVDTSYWQKTQDELFEAEVIAKYSGDKKIVVSHLLQGFNFSEIARKTSITQSQVYKIKKELMNDFQYLLDENERSSLLRNHGEEIDMLKRHIAGTATDMFLSEFTNLFLYDYDPEAQHKQWQQVQFQDTLYDIWENNDFSCTLAPREHLKTFSVLSYLVKKIFTRTYPLEINYYHLNDDIATEKFRKLQKYIERNPLLAELLDIENAQYWSEKQIVLKDGTIIKPLSYMSGVVGKHPHIIVIDDPIDRRVIYSDNLNKKAIDIFYSNIYPQITNKEEGKKVIIIGTKQRKDDLYASLPDDFALNTFAAIDENDDLLCPEIYTYDGLMKIKSDISTKHGEKYWLKEYMNVPFEALGLIIKQDWIKTYNTITPELYERMEIYQGWDLSVGKDIEKGDFTSGATIGVVKLDSGEQRIYVLNIYRDRIDFATRLRMVVDKFNTYKAIQVGVEDNAFQYDTVQTLKEQTTIPIIGIKSIRNKVETFQSELAPYFENGKIYIRQDMTELINELLSLPVGEYDDMADALKIAIKTSLRTEQVMPNIGVA